MLTAVIVQARMTSTRLPGKVLLPLGDTSLLGQVLRRCRLIAGVDLVVAASPVGVEHDPVAREAARHGAMVVRGPEDDVLERYRIAAEAAAADLVMRVTSDCPLIDPVLCSEVINKIRQGGFDYAANNLTGGWPHGLDCEAFTRMALERAAREATDPYEREHVTPWLRTHPAIRRADLPGPGGEMAGLRVTVDFPEDLAFAQAIYRTVPEGMGPASCDALLALLREHPTLAGINAMHRDKSRPRIVSQTVEEQT